MISVAVDHGGPATRYMAAKALTELNINCVDRLIEMLESDSKYARYGAAEALRQAGYASQPAVEKLIELMQTSDDATFQTYAISALTALF